MFEFHQSLNAPPSNDTVLWRYMDLSKFLAMLTQCELFFANLSYLKDPFEGHITRPMVDQIRHVQPDATDDEREQCRRNAVHDIGVIKHFRGFINVSCWHMNETESDAMWKLYMPSGQGIAIRTTFGRFQETFKKTSTPVYGGVVQYIDYNTHELKDSNQYNWSVLKRSSFAHEKEFRGIVSGSSTGEAGVNVDVDIATLIESVMVSPVAPPWHVELLRNLAMTYGLDVPINQSDMYKPEHPLYYNEPLPPSDLGDEG